MLATLNIVTNPFHPSLGKIQKPLVRKTKVNTLVQKHKIDLNKPVMCYYNGSALLRKDWNTTIVGNNDVVSFVYLPQGGGGGSNPLRMVLMIAVMVFAPKIGLAMAGGVTGTMASIYTAAIGFLGTALINALIPPPEPPKGQQAAQLASASPTYTLSAQGNQARIGQAIPVLYGRMKVFPDFAAQPYVEYENNDQYLYQLFLITQGKATVDLNDIFIEDSPISSFAAGDYDYEFVPPGFKPTLFPTAVFNTSEVNGQELTGEGAQESHGPFSVNPALTKVNKLSLDVVFPRGLYYVDDLGSYASYSASFSFEARKIDDTGANIGAPFTLGTYTVSGATPTAIRKTYSFAVPEGRYSVLVTRTTVKKENGRYGNDMVWAGARGYSSTQIDYGDATLLVLKLKANNNISQQSARKINVIAQRHLSTPTYNATTEAYDFGAELPTSSIALAIVDICRAHYGAGVSTARYDLNQLSALDALWTSRGDELNCLFDSTQTFWEALTSACRAGRVRPYVQGGMIHFVRDSLQTLPTALFTSRNIVKGSFKITYVMPSEDSADCIDVEYFDEVLWKPRVVRAAIDVGTTTKPAKVKAFGITNREQAYREGMYMAASNRYRRKEISFETELEGHIPSLGDLIAIQSDIPEWGQYGEAESVTTGQLVSNEPFEWTNGATHFMMLRRKDGSATGPIEVTQGATPATLLYNEAEIDFDIYTGFEKERTYISFGRSGQVVQLARILTTVPRGDTVQVTAINEDVRIHTADGTPIPLDVFEWSIATPKVKPILSDFTITQTGSGTTPSIAISWQPTPGASKYIIQKSTDSENWETLAEVTLSSFSFLSNTGPLYVRVAAFGGVIGPYITKSLNVGEVAPPADVTVGSINSDGQTFEANWSVVEDCEGYFIEVIADGATKREASVVDTTFSYSLENAMADGGPWRNVTIRVKARKGLVRSLNALVLNGSNLAPANPTLTVVPGAQNISITISKCEELDYAGSLLYASTTPGFTPSPLNLVYEGSGAFYLHSSAVTTYFKAAHYDTYGKTGLNYSVEYSATPTSSPSGIEVVDSLPTTDNFEGRVVYLTTDDSLYTYDMDTESWVASGSVPDGSLTNDKFAQGSFSSVGIVDTLPAGLFTRNSVASYYNKSGILKIAVANEPRFNYNPTTLALEGLLLESTTTNFALYSDDFSNAYWATKTAITVTPNSGVGSDGLMSMSRLTENTATAQRRVRRSTVVVDSGTEFTMSADIKPDPTRMGVTFYPNSGGNGAIVDFNLVTMTFSPTNVASGVFSSALIRQLPNGIFRLSVSIILPSAVTVMDVGVYFSDKPTDGNASYLGDGVSGIYIGKMQVEAGLIASSYIPTATTAATRGADVAGYTSPHIVLNNADGKIYRVNYATPSWESSLPASDVTGQITNTQIADIAAAKLTGQITSTQITDNAITTAKINAGAITAAKIAADTITANEIAANAITAAEIAAGAVTTAKIFAGAVTANEIAANAVVAGKIATAAVEADKIAANAITATKLTLADLTNIYPDYDMIDESFYSGNSVGYYYSTTTVGTLGLRYIRLPINAATTEITSGWRQCESGKDFYAEVQAWVGASTAGAAVANAYIEFGTVATSGVATPTRRVLILSRTGSASPTRGGVSVATASTERRFRFVFEREAGSTVTGTTGEARFGAPVLRRKANADLIVDGAITANHISAGAVTANKISVANLAAINADIGAITAGSLTLDNAGFVRGGQTAYNTGTGFFLGYSGATYKFSIGNSSQGLTWDGSAMTIKGNFTAGSISLGTGFTASSTGAISIKSATTGARLEITNDVIKVYDASNVLRVKLGNLSAA